MSHKKNEKRTFWVTGACSGIGLELVRLLAKQRHFIFVSGRSEDLLALLHEAYPENVLVVPMDLICPFSVEKAEAMLNKHTDHLDTLIACVGECEFDDSLRLSSDSFERMMRTNYLGVVETVRVALPFLRHSENLPHIVGVGSLSSVVPLPGAAAYGASTAALDYFLQSLKINLAEDKIDVSIVRPGFVGSSFALNNYFFWGLEVSSKKSAKIILYALKNRRLFFDFPFRLSLSLKIMRLLPFFWIRFVALKFKKSGVL